MRRDLDSRLRGIEQARGARSHTLYFADGSSRVLNLTCRNDGLQIMIAFFEMQRLESDPEAQPSKGLSQRAREVAQLVKDAVHIEPPLFGPMFRVSPVDCGEVRAASDAAPDVPGAQGAET